jgi:hypothetical protein
VRWNHGWKVKDTCDRIPRGGRRYFFKTVPGQKSAGAANRAPRTTTQLLAFERQRQEAEAELRQSELNAEIERLKVERKSTEIRAVRENTEHEAAAAREKLEAEFTRGQVERNSLLSPFVTPAPH